MLWHFPLKKCIYSFKVIEDEGEEEKEENDDVALYLSSKSVMHD